MPGTVLAVKHHEGLQDSTATLACPFFLISKGKALSAGSFFKQCQSLTCGLLSILLPGLEEQP